MRYALQIAATLVIGLLLGWWLLAPEVPRAPLLASGGGETVVMDFARGPSLDPLPDGWFHRTFWTRPAMALSYETVDGIAALRAETDGSGSIFGRHTDIAIAEYPVLAWTWRVEQPVVSPLDERTPEGDDHAARLYLEFADTEGGRHAMEIIWSRGSFQPGEYKYLGDFAHYVAETGIDRVGEWVSETVDLRELYRDVTKRDDAPRLTTVAIFCDSDDTGTHSLAYFGNVVLRRE